jgi:D-alanyl-lipoteichoic acid acyltransferase DltB (MBOAT superfamily)
MRIGLEGTAQYSDTLSQAKSALGRLVLLVASLVLITAWAKTAEIVLFALVAAALSYIVMQETASLPDTSRLRQYLGLALIAVLFLSIPALNLMGYVGTLTGNSDDQLSQLPWLLGVPFLVLQIGGVWREVIFEGEPLPAFLDYLLLLVFFPKFLSGPLERTALIKDFHKLALPSGEALEQAAGYILLGLFMKLTIGNQISRLVDLNALTPPQILLSTIAFEMRVYFDLAGYSFIALGTAAMFGVRLTCNFNHPFYARNVREFWQRWHIALGRWLHATVYSPLRQHGQNRLITTYLLSLIVFVTSAMWHGTTVNFLLWGIFHGVCFIAFVRVFRHINIPRAVGFCAMACVLVFGRLLFMDSDAHRLLSKISSLFSSDAWRRGCATFVHNALLAEGTRMSFAALFMGVAFIVAEGRSIRSYPEKPYGLFLTRKVQIVLLLSLLLLTQYVPAGMVYARQ